MSLLVLVSAVALLIERNKYDFYLTQKYLIFGEKIETDNISELSNKNFFIQKKDKKLFVNHKYPVREKFIQHLTKRLNHLELLRENKEYSFTSRAKLIVKAKEKSLKLELGDYFSFNHQFLLKINEKIYIVQDTYISDDLYRSKTEKYNKRYEALVALFNSKQESVLSYKLKDYIQLDDVNKIFVSKILKRAYTLYPFKNRLILEDTDKTMGIQPILPKLAYFSEQEWMTRVSFNGEQENLLASMAKIIFHNNLDQELLNLEFFQRKGERYGHFLKISSFPNLIFEFNHKLENPYLFEPTHWEHTNRKVENKVP
ncbi:hypothetical protein N9N67_01870 [Bacteriovoracaceae bacterium]|nr:hypothetical protein [Bacteriovoracaceae bacterium]